MPRYSRTTRMQRIGIGVVLGAIPLWATTRVLWPAPLFLSWGLFLGGFAAGFGILRWEHARMVRKLHEADYRLCLRCHYLLAGHGESGVCPECGTAFTMKALRGRWRRLYGRKGGEG